MPFERIRDELAREYGERVIAWTVVGKDTVLLFANRSEQTYTIVLRTPSGLGCVLSAGQRALAGES